MVFSSLHRKSDVPNRHMQTMRCAFATIVPYVLPTLSLLSIGGGGRRRRRRLILHRRDWLTIEENLRSCFHSLAIGVLLRRLLFVLAFLVIAALILDDFSPARDEAVCNAQDQKQPEQIDGLQAGEQCKCDVLRDPALVLLRVPVQFERTDGGEFAIDHGPEDAEVDVVAEVSPDEDEEAKVRANDGGIKVVQGFRRL